MRIQDCAIFSTIIIVYFVQEGETNNVRGTLKSFDFDDVDKFKWSALHVIDKNDATWLIPINSNDCKIIKICDENENVIWKL